MNVYRLTFRARKNDRCQFVNFETQAPSVEALVSALERGLVAGFELWTRPTPEPHVYEIVQRRAVALRMDDILSIKIPRERFVSYVDDDSSEGAVG